LAAVACMVAAGKINIRELVGWLFWGS